MFAYRPESINRTLFFEEVNKTLSSAVNKYDYIVLAGDLNIDMDVPKNDVKGCLSDLCDTFILENLINKKTCTMSKSGSSIDVILTNHPNSFKKSSVIETGTSDHHKLVITFHAHIFRKSHLKILFTEIIKSLIKINFYQM